MSARPIPPPAVGAAPDAPRASVEALIWHELECGPYQADLELWRELAAACAGPVLDVGAGSGRVAGALAGTGAQVVALDRDRLLLDALNVRWPGVRTVVADAREFSLSHDVGLVLVPMQTVQLLGGRPGRSAMLAGARAHLRGGGLVACAIAVDLEPYGPGAQLPAPDRMVRDDVVYESQPVALRARPGTWELERLRSVRRRRGPVRVERDQVDLDRVAADELRAEGEAHGLRGLAHRFIAPTPEHAGSTVVVWRG